MDYIEDLKINPDQLDIEWIEQPLLFHKYTAKSAEANKFVRKCEELVKVTRSELVLEAGTMGEAVLGKGIKSTATNIEAYFRNHATYKKVKETLHEAMYEQEMLANAVYAFHQRKVALENLTRLQGQNYFAGPTIPRELSQEYKENQREGLREQKRTEVSQIIHEKKEQKSKNIPRRTRRTRGAS